MKTTILIKSALYAVVLLAFCLVGCEEEELYTINDPADRQAKIDSIAAAKAAKNSGDTTYLTISTAIVGAEDNSTGWRGAYSDDFSIPIGEQLNLQFVNYGTGVSNWNNWNLAVANMGDPDADGYVEYFVLRSDAWGWGNEDFDLGVISNNYASDPDAGVTEDDWTNFRAAMQGANVTMKIDYSVTGYAFVTVNAIGQDETELEMTYNQPIPASEDIVVYLICDGSHFDMEDAFLVPSEVTVIEDVEPVSIELAGYPEFVELGNENFWGDAVATVTFEDGSSAQIDSLDLSFNVIPDMTTLGEKSVIVAYSKTKQGAFTQAVSSYYTLDVKRPVTDLEVTTSPDITTYYFFNSDPIIFNTSGLVITATYDDASTGVISNESLQFGAITAEAGAQSVEVSYIGESNTVTTSVPLTLVEGTSQVGATDLSTGFWGAHSADFTVASGTTKTFELYVYSTNANNWNAPVTILRKADLTENAVVRMDAFGWGDGYAAATVTHDWDFEALAPYISGSYIEVTVTNNGDNTADVHYDVTFANGDTHFQDYAGITVDSSDLTCALTVDGCYLVLVN